MKKIITTLFSLLLLTAFIAPAIITSTGIDAGIAFAQEAETTPTANAEEDAGWVAAPFIGSIKAFGTFFITIGAFLLWLAGILFNYGVQYGILEFANFANISGIPLAWTLLRDLTNIFFIFIFLAIGIGTILGLDNFGYKKRLPILLIVAVLVNFSLFFAKVGIDVAHGFAGAILNQSGVVEGSCNTENCSLSYGPATAFLEMFGFVDIFGDSAQEALGAGTSIQNNNAYESIFAKNTWGSAWKALLFGLLSFVFMSAAAIVLFGGAMILVIRIVKLLMLMISAAPAMAAMVLPNTKKYWDQWLKTFIQEALYAPVLLLLLAISLLFLNTARVTFGDISNPSASFAEVFINGSSDSVSIIIFFLISLGFLFMSIKLAGQIGGQGAGTIQAFASRRVSAMAGNTVGFVGRNSVGRLSAQGAKALAKTRFARTGPGRIALTGLKNIGDSNFDPRSIRGAAGVAKSTGADLGTPGKGFTGRAADLKKSREKLAGEFKQTDTEKETEKAVKNKLDDFKLNKEPKIKDLEKERTEKKKQVDAATDPGNKAFYQMELDTMDKEIADLKKERSNLQADLQAAKNAPQLEYATNLEKEAFFTPQGSLPEIITRRKGRAGLSKDQQEHYKKLEEEIKGLRKDLNTKTGKDREDVLVQIAEKNRETQELLRDNQKKTTTLISAAGFGGAASAQGSIDAAEAIRKANLKTKSQEEEDRDALAKAVKDAVKDN